MFTHNKIMGSYTMHSLPSLGISHISKEHWLFLEECIQNQHVGTRYAHYHKGISALRLYL